MHFLPLPRFKGPLRILIRAHTHTLSFRIIGLGFTIYPDWILLSVIDLTRSVRHAASVAEHLHFVRLIERVRATAAALFGVPLDRLKLGW